MTVSVSDILLCGLFAGADSFAGANRCACTAVDAGIGVDYIDGAFGDSFNGAFGKTGAASNTFVGNYVSHDLCLFRKLRIVVMFVLYCKFTSFFSICKSYAVLNVVGM